MEWIRYEAERLKEIEKIISLLNIVSRKLEAMAEENKDVQKLAQHAQSLLEELRNYYRSRKEKVAEEIRSYISWKLVDKLVECYTRDEENRDSPDDCRTIENIIKVIRG